MKKSGIEEMFLKSGCLQLGCLYTVNGPFCSVELRSHGFRHLPTTRKSVSHCWPDERVFTALEVGRSTVVKFLGSTRESYGSFKGSISSSSGSGFSGLRIKGRLNGHPHIAQYFSLVNMTPKDSFHFRVGSHVGSTLAPKSCPYWS